MQQVGNHAIMGEAEKLFQQPSASSRDLDWRSPVPDEDSTTCRIPLTQGKFAIVDAADFNFVNQWKWFACFFKKTNTWYAARNVGLGGKRQATLFMHRALLNAPRGLPVDHKDSNGLNNTRSNIRIATYSQNACNKRAPKNNKSGYKGVHWDAKLHNWRASICNLGKRIHLGNFPTPEEAHTAYIDAAKKLHGEFAKW